MPVAAQPAQVPNLLPEAPPQRSELPWLVLLSLALHGLAVLGAWAWQPDVQLTPQPEPVILVNLPPVAPAPAPAVVKPAVSPPTPPKPAPRPIAKPVVKPAPAPQPRPTAAPALQETSAAAPVSASASASDQSPAPERDTANARQTEKAASSASAPVSIDLNAAYRHNPAPGYPPLALRRGWQGTVRLRVTLDVQGRPTRVELAAGSGHPLLDESALAAVRQWQFRPATRLGETVVATVEVPIVFKLDR
jgi:protein TonB